MATKTAKYVALSDSSEYHLNWLENPSIHSAQTQPTNVPNGVINLPSSLPNELMYKIKKLTLQPDRRRVWLRYLPAIPPSGNPMQQIYTSQTPRPIALSLNSVSTAEAQRKDGFIEISLSDTDSRKISFSLDLDMVFVEERFPDVDRVASDLTAFRDAIQRSHGVEALGKLRSIAIGREILVATSGANNDPVRAANWQILKDFTGLELVFIVWGRRPQPQLKVNAAREGSFEIVRSKAGTGDLSTQVENFLVRGTGVGSVKPMAVIVEYKTR